MAANPGYKRIALKRVERRILNDAAELGKGCAQVPEQTLMLADGRHIGPVQIGEIQFRHLNIIAPSGLSGIGQHGISPNFRR